MFHGYITYKCAVESHQCIVATENYSFVYVGLLFDRVKATYVRMLIIRPICIKDKVTCGYHALVNEVYILLHILIGTYAYICVVIPGGDDEVDFAGQLAFTRKIHVVDHMLVSEVVPPNSK